MDKKELIENLVIKYDFNEEEVELLKSFYKEEPKLYTEEQVAELLAAYLHSDIGTMCIEEVKGENPNSFKSSVGYAKKWLNKTAHLTYEEVSLNWWENLISKEFRSHLAFINPTKTILWQYKNAFKRNK